MDNSNHSAPPPILKFQYEQTAMDCPVVKAFILVPIKDICTIMDLDMDGQMRHIKRLTFLGELVQEVQSVAYMSIFDTIRWIHTIDVIGDYPGRIEKQVKLVDWLQATIESYYAPVDVMEQASQRRKDLLRMADTLMEYINEHPSEYDELRPKIKGMLAESKQLGQKLQPIRKT